MDTVHAGKNCSCEPVSGQQVGMGRTLVLVDLAHVPHVYDVHCMRPWTTKPFMLHSLQLRIPEKLVVSYVSQKAHARVPGVASFACFMHR